MGRESTGTSGAEMESEPIVLGHASGSVLGSASGPCRGTRAKNATHLPAARIAVPARNPQAAPNKPHLGTKHQTRATVRMPPNAPNNANGATAASAQIIATSLASAFHEDRPRAVRARTTMQSADSRKLSLSELSECSADFPSGRCRWIV